MDDSNKLSAALTGMAVGAATHLIRQNTDTNDRLDRSRDDIDALNRRLRDFQANGHIVRDMMPVVADFLSGIALARSQETSPTLLPNLTTISRPDLLSLLGAAVPGFQWPPEEGEYTPNGFIQKAGELTSLGLVLTYEEVRCILTGLVLNSPPTLNGKAQAFYSSRGLIQAIVAQNYSPEGWADVWRNLLSGGVQQRPAPTMVVNGGPFTATFGPGARNEAMNIKLNVTGFLPAGTQIATIKFGSSNANPPYNNMPAIVVGGPWQIDNPTNGTFILTNRVMFNNGDTPIAAVVVGTCDGT